MAAPKLLKSLIANPLVHNTVVPYIRTPGVRVLMYHRISGDVAEFPGLHVDVFREHVAWLTRHYTPIRATDLDDAGHTERATKPAVLLTFDDGYADNLLVATPILHRFGVPATQGSIA